MIKLADKKIVQLFFLIVLLKIINGYVFTYINHTYFKLDNLIFEKLSEKEILFMAVVLSPIIETLIFQLVLFRLLNKIGIHNSLIIIVLMSFAFSQVHWYHWLYVVAAFVSGLFLNYFYVCVYKNKNELIAVLLTIVLHSSYNLFGFLFVE
ncbi:MAG: CPBP family intramembrane metalloprotease [Daejeonella sp.]|uniref:CPBP family glutamic-type intramembrane protease n=1 Tax=Daejeonella sp. TaxID=2805397 RepID=UPI00274AC47C|nr:CPBP family intramembrane metalloprotease [Daejeonella sp.]